MQCFLLYFPTLILPETAVHTPHRTRLVLCGWNPNIELFPLKKNLRKWAFSLGICVASARSGPMFGYDFYFKKHCCNVTVMQLMLHCSLLMQVDTQSSAKNEYDMVSCEVVDHYRVAAQSFCLRRLQEEHLEHCNMRTKWRFKMHHQFIS